GRIINPTIRDGSAQAAEHRPDIAKSLGLQLHPGETFGHCQLGKMDASLYLRDLRFVRKSSPNGRFSAMETKRSCLDLRCPLWSAGRRTGAVVKNSTTASTREPPATLPMRSPGICRTSQSCERGGLDAVTDPMKLFRLPSFP